MGRRSRFSAGGDRPYTAQLYDVRSGTHAQIGGGSVRPSFTPDGTAVWLGERTGAQLVAVDGGAIIRQLRPPPGKEFLRVLTMKSGDIVALATDVSSPSAVLLRLATAPDEWTVITEDTSIEAVATTRAGEVLVFPWTPPGRGLTLASWTPESGLVGADAPGVEPRAGLAFSADGTRAAWSTCRFTANLSKIENGRLVDAVERGPSYNNYLTDILSDGRLIMVSDRDGRGHKLWVAAADGTGAHPVADLKDPKSLDVSGTRVVVSAADGVWLVDLTSVVVSKQLTVSDSDTDAAFERSGTVIVQREHGATREFLRLREGMQPERLPVAVAQYPAASPTEDKIVFVSGEGTDGRLSVLADGSARSFAPTLVPALYTWPAFSKDGRVLAVVRGRSEVVLIDVATEQVIRSEVVSHGAPGEPVFGNDGRLHVNGIDWVGDVWIADVD